MCPSGSARLTKPKFRQSRQGESCRREPTMHGRRGKGSSGGPQQILPRESSAARCRAQTSLTEAKQAPHTRLVHCASSTEGGSAHASRRRGRLEAGSVHHASMQRERGAVQTGTWASDGCRLDPAQAKLLQALTQSVTDLCRELQLGAHELALVHAAYQATPAHTVGCAPETDRISENQVRDLSRAAGSPARPNKSLNPT